MLAGQEDSETGPGARRGTAGDRAGGRVTARPASASCRPPHSIRVGRAVPLADATRGTTFRQSRNVRTDWHPWRCTYHRLGIQDPREPINVSQLRTVQVLGGGAGSSAHVSSLAAGLVARGVQVTVCAPAGSGRDHGLPATGARFVAVPRRSDPAAVAALRTACTGADIVHAHGLHAAVRAGIALSGRGIPLVVTWHTRAHADGARGRLLRLLERRAARAAAVVLGTSWELVDRARRRGARDARLAPAAIPASRFAGHPRRRQGTRRTGRGRKAVAGVGGAARPRDAAGRGARMAGTGPRAAAGRRGGGPRAGALRRRIAAEGLARRPRGRPGGHRRTPRRRRHRRTLRTRRGRAAARPGGPAARRPAGRRPRRRPARTRRRCGRTRSVRGRRCAGRSRRTAAR